MLKRFLITAAVSGLMVSGALAQAQAPAKVQASNDSKFITMQSMDQWVFSKFKGTNVLGPNEEYLGDVSDMLFDKNGKIEGLVVGVGGFLGIGQKNVAIDMSSFQVMPSSAGTTVLSSATSNDPTTVKLKVSWTKDELQSAPEFQYYKAPPATATSNETSGTTGMAPRPAPSAPAPSAPAPRPQ